MKIDPSSGVIIWSPGRNQIGSHAVTVRVEDGRGGRDEQQFTLTVDANDPPTITSTPVTSATVGRPYQYDVNAADPDSGDMLTFSLLSPPTGMTIDPSTGLIQWTPSTGQVGNQPVTVHVQDAGGLFAVQSFVIAVAPEAQATTVPDVVGKTQTDAQAALSAAGLAVGTITSANHPTIPAGSVISQNPAAGVSVTPGTAVNLVISLGPATTFDVTLQIASPAPDSTITQPVNIVGSVINASPGSGTLTWTLQRARVGTSEFVTIGSGASEITNGVLGTLDPTLIPNDVYVVRLTAARGGQSKFTEVRYNVAGDLKLGNFTTSFTDLAIPVAGIPLTITRAYDSLDTSPDDFGAGWRLGLPGKVEDSANEMMGEAFTPSTRVYVTRADGRRVGFTFTATSCSLFGCLPGFIPDQGVVDTLEAKPTTILLRDGKYFTGNGAYNPQLYTFTTKEKMKYTLDELNGLQKIEDANGNTLDVTLNGLVSSTGVTLTFERDAAGRITKIIEPGGVGAGALRYVYDASGNLIQFIDQENHVTRYFYEVPAFPHYLTKIQDPLGRPVIRNVFDNNGRLIGVCDANGNPATLAGCDQFDSNATAKTQTIVNARGFRTDLFLDERGNVLRERHILENGSTLETVRTYDANNNLLTETDPQGNVKTYTYDSRGNQLTRTEGGRTTTYTYNTCNQVLTEKDPANNVTTNTYDSTGCLLRFVKDTLNNQTEYRYNAAGQVTDMIDAVGNPWRWQYDGAGFLQSMTDPSNKTATFHSNAAGELEYQIDRNGRRIDFAYDNAHRPVRESWDTSPARVTDYGYNAAGQLTSASDPDSTVGLTYTNNGLVRTTSSSGSGGPSITVTYDYDLNDNVIRVGDSLGGHTDYQYDALDRLTNIKQSGTSVNEKRVDLVYDNASLLSQLKRFANLSGTQAVANTAYSYDCGGCGGRLTGIHHRKAANNAVLHDLDFVRDNVGNLTQITDAEGVHTYTYDAVRQLKTADQPVGAQPDETYSYDTVGNRLTSHLSSSYRYLPTGNRLSQDDQFAYEYDNNGNLIRKTNRANNDRTDFTYDHRNRLVEILQFTQGGTHIDRSAYVYDAANRRIRAEENGEVVYFAYDGLNPMLKLNSSGQIISRRLYSRGLDGILADEASGQTRWFLTDQVGTVRDLIANDGSFITHYTYDSFGQLITQTNPSVVNDILFTSREFNPATGLGYFRARFYEPRLGRFVGEDPLAPFQYRYTNNNPMIFVDPSGKNVTLEAAITTAQVAYRIIKPLLTIYILYGAYKCFRNGEVTYVNPFFLLEIAGIAIDVALHNGSPRLPSQSPTSEGYLPEDVRLICNLLLPK